MRAFSVMVMLAMGGLCVWIINNMIVANTAPGATISPISGQIGAAFFLLMVVFVATVCFLAVAVGIKPDLIDQ